MTPRVISTLLITLVAMPALAAEMPARKAGLWEIATSAGNRMAIRQCIDAATDQMMQSRAGTGPAPGTGPGAGTPPCSKRDVQKTGDTVTIDSTCTVAGRTVNTHAVVTGSFDSAYTMTVTSQGDGIPAGAGTMTMSAKWLGPCAADQRPGDMIMPNGMKINILDLQKRGLPGAPPPSH
jgi:Protein of unknown function (DUF3617)